MLGNNTDAIRFIFYRRGVNRRCGTFWRVILLFCLLALATLNPPAFLLAQNRPVKFERLSREQGLSQSSVRCIMQDRQGFMWFGTEDGLNKYDGYNFTVYKHDALDSTSLSDNLVTSIYEDSASRNTLWIGTMGGGLNKFDREKEQFTHYVNDPKNPHSPSNHSIRSIYEDRAGTLWIGTEGGGLNKFDRGKEQFIRCYVNDPKNPHSLSNNIIWSIYEDRAGTLWIGTEGGLNKFDREKEQFTHYVNDPNNPYSLSNNIIASIYEDSASRNTLWIGTRNGLNRFDRERAQFTRFVNDPKNPLSLGENDIGPIYEDQAGTLWIGTWGGGLNKLDREKEQFIRFVNDPNNPHSLSDNFVFSLYIDYSGILWIGTWQGGLNKFDHKKEQFTHYVNDPKNPHSLSYNSIASIYEDRAGTFWIGTWGGGLNKFDREKEQFTHFVNDPNNPHSLSNNIIFSILEDSLATAGRNTLWIGTLGGGLNKLVLNPAAGGGEGSDREKAQFTHYLNDPKNPHSLSNNSIWSIYADHSGTLWIGTSGGGLNKFDREKEQFTHYINDPNNPYSLSDNAVMSIYEDNAGTLWIGTGGGGLNKFDHEKEQFIHYVNDPKNPHSLSNNIIPSIYEDHAGTLWIATLGGLNKFDHESGRFTRYTEKDGLPNNGVIGILEDNNGHLWLSTNKGISCFDPPRLAGKTFRNYDVGDGLQSNEFNAWAYHKSKSGEMFFGGINGFNVFHPDSIKDNPYLPPVVITAFKRYNTDETAELAIEEKGISVKPAIKLTYKDNFLLFEFAALSFRRPEKNQYAYKLEGYSDKWIHLGTKRDVTFTNLDPGEYTLRVKGSNNDGVWNEEGTSIKITITPPWWKTWWAYMLYGLMFAGAVFGYIRYKTQAQAKELARERKVNERLRQVDKLKDDFLANTSHELRTPLHGIIGLAESSVADASVKLPERMRLNLGMIIASGKRLASLVNDILDFSKLKTHHLDIQKKPLDMRVLVDLVLKFSEPLLAGKNLIFKNEIPPDLPPVEGDENRLQQILHNLVGNAIKFTESGEVRISAAQRNGMVEISVADTGIGISKDKQQDIFKSFEQVDASISREYGGTGLGLAITKSLVELHGGKIWVESEAAQGAVFTFTLPV